MCKLDIMSAINQIPYDNVNIMETLKEEAIKTLGREKWSEITANIEMPADNMESEHLNNLTRELLKRFDSLVNSQICKSIFYNVKHGLKHSDFLWARENNTIVAIAIPCETQKYMKETDINKKRYFACHCQFARNSILQKEGAVSKTLCNCSLGHTKIFWEAALDASLDGEVVSSVLCDGLLCRFVIHLPDEIMKKYVHAT